MPGLTGERHPPPSADEAQPPDLALSGVANGFESVRVLRSIFRSASKGELITPLGPSGRGTTTLRWLIVGVGRADSGSIIVNRRNLAHRPTHRRTVGIALPSSASFPPLAASVNLAFGLNAKGVPAAVIELDAGVSSLP